MRVDPAPGYLSAVAGAVVANNNRLVLGAIGCLVLTGLFGLTCIGLGTVGFLYSRMPSAPVAAAPDAVPAPRGEASATTRVDLLSDAAFLDVGAGPFAAPVAVPVQAESAPSETARPAMRPTPPKAPIATQPSEPEPPPVEDDQAPIISDEDAQALDAEVRQIQAQQEADAATDTKKKKKKN
jgi:hypothetical protein